MSRYIFQRSSWSFQITRSSRQLSVTFATKLPPRPVSHITIPFKSTRSPIGGARWSGERVQPFSTTPRSHQDFKAPISEAAAETSDLTSGFNDEPLILDEGSRQIDWSRSFHGLSTEPFPKEVADILLAPVDSKDVEVKPDGILYLPEIKYRRILNRSFGPGAWGLAPRGETIVTARAVTREYALVARGRLISVARGEQEYFSPDGIPTATEGCKSNALMRCCKDLGIASELWDPHFIRQFLKDKVREVWVEHTYTKKKKKMFVLKTGTIPSPYKAVSTTTS